MGFFDKMLDQGMNGLGDLIGDMFGGGGGGSSIGMATGGGDGVAGEEDEDSFQSLLQSSGINPNASYAKLLDQLTTYDIDEIYSKFLGKEYAPGGGLSEVSQSAPFATLARGTLGQNENYKQDMGRSLVSSGVNDSNARAGMRTADFSTLRDLLGQKAGLQTQLTENRTAAQQAFANMMAQNEIAQKQSKLAGAQHAENVMLQKHGISQSRKASRDAGLMDLAGSLGGLGLSFIPGFGG